MVAARNPESSIQRVASPQFRFEFRMESGKTNIGFGKPFHYPKPRPSDA